MSQRRGKIYRYEAPDVELIHSENLDYRGSSIYLEGDEVESKIAAQFLKNLHILSNKPGDEVILIHMKINGGHWEQGMAIFDNIRACPKPVVLLNHAYAESMSSIILQSADKRVMLPHSKFMFHEGWMETSGTSKQVKTQAKINDINNEEMLNIYIESLKETGKFKNWAKKRIRQFLVDQMHQHEEVYLSSTEAVKWGFADEVFDGDWNKLREL